MEMICVCFHPNPYCKQIMEDFKNICVYKKQKKKEMRSIFLLKNLIFCVQT